MNSRERILAAVRREPVDRVPCFIRFNPLMPEQRRGYAWNFPWPEEAPLERQIAVQVEQLGLDAVMFETFETTRPARDVVADVWREGEVLHQRYATAAGELHAAVRVTDLWPHGRHIPFYSDFNIGHFVEPWIKSAQDLECLKQIQQALSIEEALAVNRERVARAMALARRYGLATLADDGGLGLTGAQHLFGVEGICLATIEQPELVDAYLAHDHRLNLLKIEVARGFGFDLIRRNGFYETADFYGPATLTALLRSRLAAEADAVRRSGLLSVYTLNTGIMPILDYVAALEFDSLFGIDIAFHGVDLGRVRDALHGTKALWIGPSSVYHIWNGAEATRAAVRQVFECFGKTGWILAPCVSVHSIMPWASTLALIAEWQKLR
jgi:hypothetical protein